MNLIAETAWHHDGNLNYLKKLVNAIVCDTLCDFIKFHITLNLDEYMTKDHFLYHDLKLKMFSISEWKDVLQIPVKNGRNIVLLFNDQNSIDFGMQFNPNIVEIHSSCTSDFKLIKYLKGNINNDTKIILGIGGSDIYEIDHIVNLLETDNIILMHGIQNYPTNFKNINLKKILRIMKLFPEFEHGYADHTAWDDQDNLLVTLFGAAIGMNYIEKHITITYGEERTDWQSAISIEMTNKLKNKLEILKECWGSGNLVLNPAEISYSSFGQNKKAAILNRNAKSGEIIDEEMISFKRTNQYSDLSTTEVLNLLGKQILKDLEIGHCLVRNDYKEK